MGSGKKLEEVSIRCVTGDNLVADLELKHVSLIKIDTDGFDYPILEGFAYTIESKRPIFQFEYSRFWFEGRHYLKDALRLFESNNYVVGRLMPKWVEWISCNDYSYLLETHLTNNFVAIPAEQESIIQKLSRSRW